MNQKTFLRDEHNSLGDNTPVMRFLQTRDRAHIPQFANAPAPAAGLRDIEELLSQNDVLGYHVVRKAAQKFSVSDFIATCWGVFGHQFVLLEANDVDQDGRTKARTFEGVKGHLTARAAVTTGNVALVMGLLFGVTFEGSCVLLSISKRHQNTTRALSLRIVDTVPCFTYSIDDGTSMDAYDVRVDYDEI